MFNHETFNQTDTSFNHIYLGVVENNNSPSKDGRVQVRIAGLHTPQKNKNNITGVPTDELPWALPMMPITTGAVSGLGYNGVPRQGDWIALFFIGGNHNNPVYFGALKATPVTAVDSEVGFNDPDGKYPLEAGQSDWNKEGRGDGSEEIKTIKDENLETFEPASPAEPTYPNNTVFETPDGGIVVEYDSTPTKERWHVFHKASKSYVEIGPTGDMVMKSTGDKYEISAKGRKIFIKENDDQQIDGALTITVAGNATINAATVLMNGTTASNVVAPAVNLGDAAGGKALMTEDIISIFNDHVHMVNTEGADTDTTTTPLSTGEATSKTKAT